MGHRPPPPPRASAPGSALTLLAALATVAVAAAALAAPPGRTPPAPPIAVVVGHGLAPSAPMGTTLVAGLFGRKRLLWDDGSPIHAVNLPAAHPLRREFSTRVFHRTPEEMQDYWNTQYFHGVLPPPVLASEEAVIRFVAATPGAIGYVSGCSVDKRVDVVATLGEPEGLAACGH